MDIGNQVVDGVLEIRMGWLRLVGSLKNIDLFCQTALLNRLYSAKETSNLKEYTNRSHPMGSNTKYP